MADVPYGEPDGGGYGGYDAYDGDGGVGYDPPGDTRTDEVIALCRLGLGCCFLVVGLYSLFRFYRARWILDIRTRSVYLVMVGGTSVLLTMLVIINEAIEIVYDNGGLDWFWIALLLFSITPALLGSYICRALRLAVVFHPKAKRTLPWLIPERNYIAVLLVGSLFFTAVPVYDEFIWEAGAEVSELQRQLEIIERQSNILTWVIVTFAITQASLYPFIRKVDDLFNISKELTVVTVAMLLLAIKEWLEPKFGVYEKRWLGTNTFFVLSAFVFCVSVVDPLRRLAFDPLAATKRNYADRILLARQETRSTVRTASGASSGIGAESQDDWRAEKGGSRARRSGPIRHGDDSRSFSALEAGTSFMAATHATAAHGREQERGGEGRGRAGARAMEVWSFERLGRTPLLAAAFEDFSRKALCHESVLFLSEVSRYEAGDYASSSSSPPSQFGTFCYITETFIKVGSVEEVNISDGDKKRIVELYQRGQAAFERIDVKERSMVFGIAYVEVRQMLEANLLRRFLSTDRFKSLRVQRENMQLLMDSPKQAVPPIYRQGTW